MISNDPDFLANVCAAIYAEDPIGFDVKRAWARASIAIDNLSSGFRLMDLNTKIAINVSDDLAIVIDKKCLRSNFHYEGGLSDEDRS